MTICDICGWANRAEALFCAHCGDPLEATPIDGPDEAPWSSLPDEAACAPGGQPDAADEASIISDGTPTTLLESSSTDDEPLVVGSLLQGRFQIVELVEERPEARLYRAVDLQRCGICGQTAAADAEGYCPACGGLRATPCFVRLTEQWRQAPPPHEEHLALPDRDYYISAEAPVRASVSDSGWGLLRIGARTDPGVQREVNEDAFDSRVYERTGQRRLALLAVADGLGGQARGEVASQLAIETLWQRLFDGFWSAALLGAEPTADPPTALQGAVLAADRAVAAARAEQGDDMSSTLVAALLVDDALWVANVGDSRAYLLDNAGLRRLTHDHSLVQRLVDAGKLEPEDVYTHPHRNVIFNSLGDAQPATVDLFDASLSPDARLLLCSDGLWEMVRDDGLEEVLLAEHDPQRACDLLVERANLAGGEDNITVIVAQLERPGADA